MKLHPWLLGSLFWLLLQAVPVKASDMPLVGGPLYLQPPPGEEQKIQLLLQYVEQSGAVFIRNGSEHNCKDAAAHLKMKLQKAGNRIRTARDFIDLIASKSSTTGEAYQMKMKNGSVMPVRDILYYELRKIESGKVGFWRKRSVNNLICAVTGSKSFGLSLEHKTHS